MPAATAYERQYNFQNFQATQPTVPLPADKVDSEYDAIKLTLDEILSNLNLIQRSDGALANGSVGLDQLAANITLGINVPTVWESGESYVTLDAVFVGTGLYRCLVAHTSGVFNDDFIAGKWQQLCDFADILVAGNNGWSPVFSVESDSARRVLKVVDWTGGAGTAPDDGVYVGASGFVAAIGDAVDIRGAAGANGTGTGTVVGPDSSVSGNIATYDDTSGESIADSGVAIADLQAVSEKGSANGYAELDGDGTVPTDQLPDAVLGTLQDQGTWNASTNTPTIPAASTSNKGHFYRVATAGTTTVDGISEWAVNDWIVSNGATWTKADHSDAVTSVAGRTGVVTLVKGDVGLGNVSNTADADKPVSTATQTALDAKSDITRGVRAQTGTSDTLVLADAGRVITHNNVSAITQTIPPNSSVAFPTNTQIDLLQLGAGQVSVAPGSGVTLNSASSKRKLSGQYSAGTLLKTGTDTWVLFGDIAA